MILNFGSYEETFFTCFVIFSGETATVLETFLVVSFAGAFLIISLEAHLFDGFFVSAIRTIKLIVIGNRLIKRDKKKRV
ncbi:hypothetical protein KBB05_03870 [Patescibacteria group bacterium]|nr:hypothetical protein [Patescibacteria group bacterium]